MAGGLGLVIPHLAIQDRRGGGRRELHVVSQSVNERRRNDGQRD